MKKIKIFKKTIKITPTRIFVLTISFFLIVSIILRLLTPKASYIPDVQRVPQLETPSGLTQVENTFDITVSAEIPKLPKELPVYSAGHAVDLPILAETMANSLGLSRVESRNYVWHNSDKTSSVIYSEYQRQITLFNSIDITGQPVQLERAISVANTFVQNNIGISNLHPDLSRIRVDNISPNENHGVNNLPTGNMIEIKFIQKIEEFDLLYNNNVLLPLEISIGSNYQILKVVINGLLPELTEVSKQRVFDKSEIVNAIKIGQGTIVYLDDGTLYSPVGKRIDAVNLTNAQIEYRSFGNTSMIYPYIRFSGKALLEGSRSAEIQIIYPIVHTTAN